MTVTMGAGSVVGSLISASRRSTALSGLAVAALGWGIGITIAALCPTLTLVYIVLVFVG